MSCLRGVSHEVTGSIRIMAKLIRVGALHSVIYAVLMHAEVLIFRLYLSHDEAIYMRR